MRLIRLALLAVRDLPQSRARVVIAAAGIALGVAVLMVIAGLGLGVRERVLAQVVRRLPLDVVEVVPKTVDLGLFKLGTSGLFGGATLDQATVARLQSLPEVAVVYPKLDVKLPLGAQGGATLFGRRLYTDLFMNGLPVELLAPEVGEAFHDRDDFVPVVISDQLIEVYNGSVAPSLGTPKLTGAALVGFEFELVVGRSLMLGSRGAIRTGVLRARIVGVSRYALRLGVTVPVETARRLMATYGDSAVPEQFQSILVRAKSAAQVPEITAAARSLGFDVDESAARVSDVMTAATFLGGMVGVLVLLLASLNIAHSFFASLSERRRELAVLRAVGARQSDLMGLVVIEAALVGAMGAVVGILAARLLAWLGDWAANTYLPDFPFKPDAFFFMPLQLHVTAFLLAVLAAVAGALWPAIRAARAPVARALSD